jgi:hypothetical protein
MRFWVRNIAFLLLVGASLGRLGFIARDLYQVLSFLSFLVFVSTFLPEIRFQREIKLSQVIGAGLVVLMGVWMAVSADLGSFQLYLLLSIALALVTWRPDCQANQQLASYVVAFACLGLLAELVRIFPALWHFSVRVAASLSWMGEKLANEDRNLGPTALGLPLLVALVVLTIVREIGTVRRRRYRWIAGVALLVLTHIAYLVMLKYYARWIAGKPTAPGWLILNSQHLFLILGGTVYTLFDRGRPMRSLLPARRPAAVYASAIALVAAAAVSIIVGGTAPPAHKKARVMIYDAGYVNWDIPVHGVYGERSAGMFGMFPSTLEASGFEVVVSDDLSILAGPDAPDCVVMINIQKYMEDEDKERVWQYIAGGGGLLCLGDHTGVAGIRGPFNDLLEPVGIRFLFDSATFFGEGWIDALDYRVHPLNCGVTNAEDFQMWVGASLDLDFTARPVIVGRYGYSDIGDAANIARSYLGDRRYNPDELLGEVVLVADARYGRGKVVVYGDTSGFQNLSLARSLDTVVRTLDYLATPGGFGPGRAAQLVGLIALLLLALITTSVAKNPLPIVCVAVGLAVGSAVVSVATPTPPTVVPSFLARGPRQSSSTIPHVQRQLAILDMSHGGHHTLRAWRDKSIGGLQLNLARNGYFPVIREAFPYRDLRGGAKLLVVIAPTRPYNRREIDAIEEFARNGGTVLVSVGFEERHGSRALLERFGLEVSSIPLGKFQAVVMADTSTVVIREGWPVQADGATPSEVLVSEWGYPLVVRRPTGNGEVLLIGDSSFFHDVNLETLKEYTMANIAFLRKLVAVEPAE